MSLIILKPEALAAGNVGKILSVFEKKDYIVDDIKSIFLTPEIISRLCEEHKGKHFYDGLYNGKYIYQKIIVAILRHRSIPNAIDLIKSIRILVGEVDRPGSIRGNLAITAEADMIYTSDSPASADREIASWFGKSH